LAPEVAGSESNVDIIGQRSSSAFAKVVGATSSEGFSELVNKLVERRSTSAGRICCGLAGGVSSDSGSVPSFTALIKKSAELFRDAEGKTPAHCYSRLEL